MFFLLQIVDLLLNLNDQVSQFNQVVLLLQLLILFLDLPDVSQLLLDDLVVDLDLFG